MRLLLPFLVIAAIPGAAQPDPLAIIKRSVAVNDADFKVFDLYSRRETDEEVRLNRSGQTSSKVLKTIEVTLMDGSPYEKLVMRNGQPLSTQEQDKEEDKFQLEKDRRRNESSTARAARIAKFQKSRGSDLKLMHQVAEAFDFKFAREELVKGRPAYVLDGAPNPNFRPDNAESKVLTGMRGQLWVDKASHHWVKAHIEVIKPVSYGLFIAKVDPGTQIEFELAPIDGEIWLPIRFLQDLNAKVLGVKSIRTRAEETYTNYHRTGDSLASR